MATTVAELTSDASEARDRRERVRGFDSVRVAMSAWCAASSLEGGGGAGHDCLAAAR